MSFTFAFIFVLALEARKETIGVDNKTTRNQELRLEFSSGVEGSHTEVRTGL